MMLTSASNPEVDRNCSSETVIVRHNHILIHHSNTQKRT